MDSKKKTITINTIYGNEQFVSIIFYVRECHGIKMDSKK